MIKKNLDTLAEYFIAIVALIAALLLAAVPFVMLGVLAGIVVATAWGVLILVGVL